MLKIQPTDSPTQANQPLLLALETTTDDVFEMAARAGQYRQAYLVTLELLADRERQLRRSRESHRRLQDQYRHLRAAIMHSDLGRAA